LTQTNREQAAFTYAISHDLKSPSNTIDMLLNELKFGYREVLDADGRELIELALQTTHRMARLVDDVLTYSRCIDDRSAMAPVDLDSVLAEVIADLRYDIGKTNARIRHEPLPQVQGFRMQIKLLLQNLIANAVKFRAPDRAPVIAVSARAARGGRVLLSVQDNGIGIAPEFQERVFGLFQRLHSHETYEGSGIGLALSRRIAANHGGDIKLQSRPGQGSIFTVSLKRSAE
jgi:light-regulated signal transduction histidine kinase (bacteriophytochrome)